MYEIIVGLICGTALGFYALKVFGGAFRDAKNVADAKREYQKLQLKMNEARHLMDELPGEPSDIVSSGLEGLGIGNITDLLKMDSNSLADLAVSSGLIPAVTKPIAVHFIDGLKSKLNTKQPTGETGQPLSF